MDWFPRECLERLHEMAVGYQLQMKYTFVIWD